MFDLVLGFLIVFAGFEKVSWWVVFIAWCVRIILGSLDTYFKTKTKNI